MNQNLETEQFNAERTEVQILVRKIIREDIYCNQSRLIDELLNAGVSGFDYDNLINEPADIDSEEYREIFEWWAVSQWLASHLKGVGAPLIDNDYGIWWGRTECGQSLEFDARLDDVACAILNVEDK